LLAEHFWEREPPQSTGHFGDTDIYRFTRAKRTVRMDVVFDANDRIRVARVKVPRQVTDYGITLWDTIYVTPAGIHDKRQILAKILSAGQPEVMARKLARETPPPLQPGPPPGVQRPRKR
jgi:hypothetical protein